MFRISVAALCRDSEPCRSSSPEGERTCLLGRPPLTPPPLSVAPLPPQALFCNVPDKHVLTMHDVSNIWRVPLMMESQGAHRVILAKLGLPNADRIDLSLWRTTLADRWDALTEPVSIALIGQ